MKLTRFTSLLAVAAIPCSAHAASYLIDFSRNDNVNGHVTSSPDAFSNHWNNMAYVPTSGNSVANGLSLTDLVDVDNQSSTIDLTLTDTDWQTNGRQNGALIAPNGPQQSLLGDFAIETATEDYFFVNNASATLSITGLDPALTYNFDFFGSRFQNNGDGDVRTSRYTITDLNGPHFVDLVTTGLNIGSNGIYDGNDDEIVSLNDMVPTASGTMEFQLSIVNGGFAYINAMRITSVPEPSTVALLGAVAPFVLRRRRRA